MQVDGREDDGAHGVVVGCRRISADDSRLAVAARDEVIAENELPRAPNVLYVFTIGHVEADRGGAGRARDPPVGPDRREALDPRDIEREADQKLAAVLAVLRQRDVGAPHHLKDRARRVDDFELRIGAAPGEVDGLVGRHFESLDPARLEQPHAVERERHHGEQRKQHQAGADAEPRRSLIVCAIGAKLAARHDRPDPLRGP